MTELTALDREVLTLIARFEGSTDPDMHDAMTQYAARQLLTEVAEYDVPGVPLCADTLSLIAQLQQALPPVPDGGWRSHVAGIGWQASHMLIVAGVRV
jgi:hypothetical protein